MDKDYKGHALVLQNQRPFAPDMERILQRSLPPFYLAVILLGRHSKGDYLVKRLSTAQAITINRPSPLKCLILQKYYLNLLFNMPFGCIVTYIGLL